MKAEIAVLGVALVCSCGCRNDGSPSPGSDDMARRRNEVAQIVGTHYQGSDYGFEIRGPLTPAQFEHELRQMHEEASEIKKKAYGVVEQFLDSGTGRSFSRLEKKRLSGDELYFFSSDTRSWSNLVGKEGYVLVRGNHLVDLIVTRIN